MTDKEPKKELTEREKVIDKVYTDVKTGYGSIKQTLDEAKKINGLITYEDVKTYLNKFKFLQTFFFSNICSFDILI